ncbi:M55 family metallopeptidase [Rhizohabitans arisaemae]|uniref:M55 family metallopeptidase n=1 Tax=Rhizohabitans arisaemae TaxID=2720610 RepID=UPI0024B1EA7D|nr:M55 family metallopeptidase [Rhizohabitans arisaemae]
MPPVESALRILVSVDMEGVAGIVHATETNPEGHDYARGRRLMTAEANAVVAGVLAAAPGARVTVADSHGPFRNIHPEELDPRARLIRGKPRALGMLAGVRDGCDGVIFVGYHGRAGGPGVLAHTINDTVLDVRVDGRPFGEIGLNAALAGAYGVPVLMLGGDDVACAEFAELVPEGVAVATKRALGQSAAESLHPDEACGLLRRNAELAVRVRDRVAPVPSAGPVQVEIDLFRPASVELALLIPGVSRGTGARTVTYTSPDFAEAYRIVQLVAHLGRTTP